MSDALEQRGVVLGIDVGYSPARASTCFCTLSWDESAIRLEFALTTSSEAARLRALDDLVGGSDVTSVAIDGPLAHGLAHVNHYRAAEALLSQGVLQQRGKPGPTNGPVGQDLHRHATELARLTLQTAVVRRATHAEAITPERVVEAFPNMYLAALVREQDIPVLHRDASDAYWRCLVDATDGLMAHLRALLPGRDLTADLCSIGNHDHRAGVVCALTALGVAKGTHVAVGDLADGDIMLPPQAHWAGADVGADSWLAPVLRKNLAALRDGRRRGASFPHSRIMGMSE